MCIRDRSNAAKGIIAIKKKNEKAIEFLREAIKDEDNITIHLLPDIYPMGEERAVVRECLGKLLDPTQLPSAADAVVINCETLQMCIRDRHRPQCLHDIYGRMPCRRQFRKKAIIENKRF